MNEMLSVNDHASIFPSILLILDIVSPEVIIIVVEVQGKVSRNIIWEWIVCARNLS